MHAALLVFVAAHGYILSQEHTSITVLLSCLAAIKVIMLANGPRFFASVL